MHDPSGHNQYAMLDSTAGRPVVPRGAVVRLMAWCAIEATLCAFAMRPLISEVVSDFAGYNVNPIVLVVLPGIFLTIIIAGSFASIHALNDAIKAKKINKIVSEIVVQLFVAMFQVLFLYRELVDATMDPWLAQQGLTLDDERKFGLAFGAWVGVRVMTWYLFGRSGAPTLAAVLSRQAGTDR
jgi:hypothetical protein